MRASNTIILAEHLGSPVVLRGNAVTNAHMAASLCSVWVAVLHVVLSKLRPDLKLII